MAGSEEKKDPWLGKSEMVLAEDVMINVKHNLIFIRIPRTASTTIGNVSFVGNGAHTRAVHVRKIMERNLTGCLPYLRMYKFGFVRNPWDRLLSGWSYKKDEVDKEDFNRFVLSIIESRMRKPFYLYPQWKYLYDDHERPMVDFIGRYENLQEDWEKVCSRLGMHEDLQPHNIGKQLSYVDYYSNEAREKVAELYQKDIEIFNYEYQESAL